MSCLASYTKTLTTVESHWILVECYPPSTASFPVSPSVMREEKLCSMFHVWSRSLKRFISRASSTSSRSLSRSGSYGTKRADDLWHKDIYAHVIAIQLHTCIYFTTNPSFKGLTYQQRKETCRQVYQCLQCNGKMISAASTNSSRSTNSPRSICLMMHT